MNLCVPDVLTELHMHHLFGIVRVAEHPNAA